MKLHSTDGIDSFAAVIGLNAAGQDAVVLSSVLIVIFGASCAASVLLSEARRDGRRVTFIRNGVRAASLVAVAFAIAVSLIHQFFFPMAAFTATE